MRDAVFFLCSQAGVLIHSTAEGQTKDKIATVAKEKSIAILLFSL